MLASLVLQFCGGPPDDTGAPTLELWVSDYLGARVVVVDPASGASLATIAPVPGAQSSRPWVGGWLLAAEVSGEVLSWDGQLRTLISGAGSPTAAIQVGSEILVADFVGDVVRRYDAATGALIGPLATGLDGPDAGMALGPDGRVWVPLFDGNEVVTIDPDDGRVRPFADVFRPRGIAFGDGEVYVTSWSTNVVRRYGIDGTRLPDLATVGRPTGLALEPDGAAIWVASDQSGRVVRLDTVTGEVLDELDTGLSGGTFLTLTWDHAY